MLNILNTFESDILLYLKDKGPVTQRTLSKVLGRSLGAVNQSIKILQEKNYLDNSLNLTTKADIEISKNSPKSAIILAAGLGLRMVPINNSISKGLLEIKGEPLIERIINQLNSVGVSKIYIVVGFMKEQYEYLIDKYQVELIVNKDYAFNNSIFSLYLAKDYISNTYVIPCDIWCKENPFRRNELYSWYMVSDELSFKSRVKINSKNQLVYKDKNVSGNRMIGISYLTEVDSGLLKSNISKLLESQINNGLFWEDALMVKGKFLISARQVNKSNYFEIDTYEQLRALDSNSNQLQSKVIELLAAIFCVNSSEITDISALKKGMTNRSFLFRVNGKKYIMRIPGEGTDMLINRNEEASVYDIIRDKKICDNIIYLDPNNGFKVTEFLNGARTCDPLNIEDVKKCMSFLRKFHEKKFRVKHTFDIFKQIDFYESLWNGKKSAYRDYEQTKEKVFELKEYIKKHKKEYCLTHIDAVPDNFLFINVCGKENIRLIDWEYSGMQDPDVDLAMFAIYALYNKDQIDNLIENYYIEGYSKETKLKIYSYISVCGLLWSNWCEYKRILGVEFGEYALRQYRYAKDYYQLVKKELSNE